MNNNAECGYDGGDCCSCTCVDGSFYTCGSFVCVDPDAACSSTSSSSATDDDVYLTYNNDYYRSTSVYDDDACTGREFGGTGFCSSVSAPPVTGSQSATELFTNNYLVVSISVFVTRANCSRS